MINVLYKVVFEGDLLPGHEQSDVQKKLAKLFGVDSKTAGKLFSGKQHKVKSQLNLKQAKKYVRAFAKLGALGYIEQEIIEQEVVEQEIVEQKVVGKDGPLALPPDKFTETGSFDVAAVRAFFEKQEEKKAELDKSARHEIFSLDEFDEQAASMQDDPELSGVQNVLNAEQIAKM
ncbi:MAG: hypothetical protein OQL16_00270, partial [Gammaproteobacteria bacterium]|nr:hypothetical protein [Gammaproteobacteria bacterium]